MVNLGAWRRGVAPKNIAEASPAFLVIKAVMLGTSTTISSFTLVGSSGHLEMAYATPIARGRDIGAPSMPARQHRPDDVSVPAERRRSKVPMISAIALAMPRLVD